MVFSFTKKVKHLDQRVGVFIDVQNLYHSAKHLFKARVNFKEVLAEAASGRKLIRALAYVVQSESEEEKTFFDALVRQGIEIKVKDLQIFYGGMKKADWDVGLTVDAINMAHALDVVVIVSGDGDFVPLVEHLKVHGKVVEAIAFDKSASSKLKEAVHHFVDLGEDKKRFLMKVK